MIIGTKDGILCIFRGNYGIVTVYGNLFHKFLTFLGYGYEITFAVIDCCCAVCQCMNCCLILLCHLYTSVSVRLVIAL
jgi:hypothetical protein